MPVKGDGQLIHRLEAEMRKPDNQKREFTSAVLAKKIGVTPPSINRAIREMRLKGWQIKSTLVDSQNYYTFTPPLDTRAPA